jgi:hypothetical protein
MTLAEYTEMQRLSDRLAVGDRTLRNDDEEREAQLDATFCRLPARDRQNLRRAYLNTLQSGSMPCLK